MFWALSQFFPFVFTRWFEIAIHSIPRRGPSAHWLFHRWPSVTERRGTDNILSYYYPLLLQYSRHFHTHGISRARPQQCFRRGLFIYAHSSPAASLANKRTDHLAVLGAPLLCRCPQSRTGRRADTLLRITVCLRTTQTCASLSDFSVPWQPFSPGTVGSPMYLSQTDPAARSREAVSLLPQSLIAGSPFPQDPYPIPQTQYTQAFVEYSTNNNNKPSTHLFSLLPRPREEARAHACSPPIACARSCFSLQMMRKGAHSLSTAAGLAWGWFAAHDAGCISEINHVMPLFASHHFFQPCLLWSETLLISLECASCSLLTLIYHDMFQYMFQSSPSAPSSRVRHAGPHKRMHVEAQNRLVRCRCADCQARA